MSTMHPEAYLQRIGYAGPREPTARVLRGLHRAHLQTVPFENLDILLGRPLSLSLPDLYDKIVVRRRGGFCYELNGLFAWLLETIGFQVRRLSARVFDGTTPGPEFDHLTLRVEAGTTWLADVGFGDFAPTPLRLRRGIQQRRQILYRLRTGGDGWLVDRRRPPEGWEGSYRFGLTPRRLTDFLGMCRYHQTSPASSFTQRSIITRATPDGRLTLAADRWIISSSGGRREVRVRDAATYRELLREHFGVDLESEADPAVLMEPRLRS